MTIKRKPKYLEVLNKYLRWADYCDFDRYTEQSLQVLDYYVSYNIEALSAEEIIFNWESKGIKIGKECSNPKLLCKYIYGKEKRDLHISLWKEEISLGYLSLFESDLLLDLIWLGDLKALYNVKVPYEGYYKTYKEWSMTSLWTL